MAFRFRRTMQILPGLRVGLTNKGASLRVGPQGAGYTVNTRGDHRVSAGIPGTGLHWSEKLGRRRRKAPTGSPQIGAEQTGEPTEAAAPVTFSMMAWNALKLIGWVLLFVVGLVAVMAIRKHIG